MSRAANLGQAWTARRVEQAMSTPDGEEIQAEVGKAIADVLSTRGNEFTTRWVALVEAVDADGKRGLWTMTSDDLMAWDTCGLLTHALHLQQAQTARETEG